MAGATTADAFNRGSEPADAILDALAGGERQVNDLWRCSGWLSPGVQAPARAPEVGAVDVRDEGLQRMYRLNGRALSPSRLGQDLRAHVSERFDELDDVLKPQGLEQEMR